MNEFIAEAMRSEAVRVLHRSGDYASVETTAHSVGGFKLQVKGAAFCDVLGTEGSVVIEAWKFESYFEASADIPPLTSREARQMAHVLLAVAEEVDGLVGR